MVLDTGWDDAWLFALAAVLGGIGGLTYELLLTVSGRTGAIERPGPLDPRHADEQLKTLKAQVEGGDPAAELSAAITSAEAAMTATVNSGLGNPPVAAF